VEDDPEVLAATSMLLTSLGMQVSAAASSGEALALLEENGVQQDMIIADYWLPDGSGTEVVERARRMSGRVTPALLVAGATSRKLTSGMDEAGTIVLHKPVRTEELVAHINNLLQGPGE
jgi:DNA-binding response OmpR family regulator